MTVSFENKAVKNKNCQAASETSWPLRFLSVLHLNEIAIYQEKKLPTNHHMTDVETSTFISVENKTCRRAHSFHNVQTVERLKPRKHATPSHSISLLETAAQYTRTYIGRQGHKVDRSLTGNSQVPAAKKAQVSHCSRTGPAQPPKKTASIQIAAVALSFSNWVCHPKLWFPDSSCSCRLRLPPKNYEFADCSCSLVATK